MRMCTHLYPCVHVCIHVYNMHLYRCVPMFVPVCTCLYPCVYASVPVCMHSYPRVRICVVAADLYLHIHIYVYSTCRCVYLHLYLHLYPRVSTEAVHLQGARLYEALHRPELAAQTRQDGARGGLLRQQAAQGRPAVTRGQQRRGRRRRRQRGRRRRPGEFAGRPPGGVAVPKGDVEYLRSFDIVFIDACNYLYKCVLPVTKENKVSVSLSVVCLSVQLSVHPPNCPPISI